MADGQGGELLVYVGMGQSLLALTPYLRPLAGKSGPLERNRAWVFAENGDPRFGTKPLRDLPEEALLSLHPHMRGGRSGPLTAASEVVLAAMGPKDQLLTVNLAQKGAKVADFGGDTQTASFRNLERCLTRAAETAQTRGLRFDRLVVSWVQGQADRRAMRSRYHARLAALVDDVETLFRRIVGDHGKVLFCLSQTTATEGPGQRCISLSQSDLAVVHPDRCIVAGPEYMLERSDGVHLKPRSARYLGALHGRAIVSWLRGANWTPLQMDNAVLDGTSLLVSFTGGVGPLEETPAHGFDKALGIGVRQLAQLGFRWIDANNPSAGLVEAAIVGPRSVRLELSHPVNDVAGCKLLLGFPDGIGRPEGFVTGTPALARGGATNLRTVGEAAPGLGLKLQDWALQQVIGVTAAA